MPDGKQWMLRNLSVAPEGSYCYGNDDANCRKYGRLYTWESAKRVCPTLGKGWRLPSDAEWGELSGSYGSGAEAYGALRERFEILLGGGRDLQGGYSRLEAHGFYWTSTPGVYYNFASGRKTLFRQTEGEPGRAFSVRCVRE